MRVAGSRAASAGLLISHPKLVNLARPETTGPATPKHAVSTIPKLLAQKSNDDRFQRREARGPVLGLGHRLEVLARLFEQAENGLGATDISGQDHGSPRSRRSVTLVGFRTSGNPRPPLVKRNTAARDY